MTGARLANARTMRRDPTPPERALWHALRDRRLQGWKFRRQMPFGPCILDFFCPAARLVLEVDGETHADPRTDAACDAWLRAQGCHVLHFWNNEVMGNQEGVLLVILARLAAIHPSPHGPHAMTRRPTRATPPAPTAIEDLKHPADVTRRNIPTAETQGLMAAEEAAPKPMLYPRNPDLDPQLVWRGKDDLDREPLSVPTVPIYIQEKILPEALIRDLRRQSKGCEPQTDLFGGFDRIEDPEVKTEFYAHAENWSNRMILGDSLLVMNSLAEKEGLRGQVQCIYIDPPYGIRFASN